MPWGGGELAATTTEVASLEKGESAVLHDFGSPKAQPLEGPHLGDGLHTMTEQRMPGRIWQLRSQSSAKLACSYRRSSFWEEALKGLKQLVPAPLQEH